MTRKKIANMWYTFVQLCSIPFEIFILRYFYIKINRPNTFNLPPGVLFIANHQSRVDPFLITYCVGFKNLKKILPVRFPITSKYMSQPFFKYFLGSLGGYDVGVSSMDRMKKLLYTRDILRRKGSVLLFPEGRINKTGYIDCSQFKDGVNVLFYEDTPIVFVRITGFLGFSWSAPTGTLRRTIEYSEVITEGTPEEKLSMMQEFYQK
jgi:1-acyl-sn-glycerol-3-phosphate acyltransferase